MSAKKYGDPQSYEAKLEKVMQRLGVETYDYDWSRRESWVSFCYKGQPYRFTHSIENAQAHGVNIQYGSDVFAQVVLSLEDIARMVERGIYDLSTWVAGMKALPPAIKLEPCFQAMGFSERPKSADEIKARYRQMARMLHPDSGGIEAEAFQMMKDNYNACLRAMEEAT